jgi:tetratricopeptide (TPR) repeat protein
MQGKLDLAFKTYLKIHKKKPADEEVINMLAEIGYDLKDYKETIKFINQYLKFKTRDVDKMTMKAISLEALMEKKEAIETHKKILELQPYNTFSRDKIRELSQFV